MRSCQEMQTTSAGAIASHLPPHFLKMSTHCTSTKYNHYVSGQTEPDHQCVRIKLFSRSSGRPGRLSGDGEAKPRANAEICALFGEGSLDGTYETASLFLTGSFRTVT